MPLANKAMEPQFGIVSFQFINIHTIFLIDNIDPSQILI
jgi:hypothetical protein